MLNVIHYLTAPGCGNMVCPSAAKVGP